MDSFFRRLVVLWIFGQVCCFEAGAEVVVDINEPNHLKLRFEKIPIVVSDPGSVERLTLDLRFPSVDSPWQGLEFRALPEAGVGYRASILATPTVRLGSTDFRVSDSRFDVFGKLPISGESVLAQSWLPEIGILPAEGDVGPVQYIWDVNHSVGAGFGLFGTLEAFVIPEPGLGGLVLLGVLVVSAVGTRDGGKKLARVGKNSRNLAIAEKPKGGVS